MKVTTYMGELSLTVQTVHLTQDSEIFNINLYPDTSDDIRPDTLYLYDIRDLQLDLPPFFQWTMPTAKEGLLNLCIIARHERQALPTFPEGRANVFLLCTDAPFSEVFNRMTQPLSELVYFEHHVYLLEQAAKGGSAASGQIVTIAGNVLQNPVLCITTHQHIMHWWFDASRPYTQKVDVFLREIEQTRILPERIDLNLVKLLEVDENIRTCQALDCHTMAMPIRVRGIEVAYLVMLDVVHPFSRFDRRFFRRTAECLTRVLRENKEIISGAGIKNASYLQGLLFKRVRTETEFRRLIEKTGLKTDADGYVFYAMVVQNRAGQQQSAIFDVAARFRGLLTPHLYTVNGTDLVALLNFPKQLKLERSSFIAAVQAETDLCGRVTGISNAFTDISLTSQAYAQAKDAASLGDTFKNADVMKSTTVFFFRQIMPLALLTELSTVTNLEKYIDPALIFLLEYDKTHGTDYLRSLHQFYISNGNYADAAARANVHKNTMTYRIKKVCELTGISITDSTDSLRLHLSFIIMQAAGIFPESQV